MEIEKLVRKNVLTLKPYSSARDEFSDKAEVYLDANENPFDNGVNRYPDPYQNKVKDQLASIKGVPAKNILLGNGSDEVIDLLFRAFCEPKVDNVISCPPTYGMYKVLSGINDIENKTVPLTDSFQLKVDEVINAVNENTKLIFICSPNNPSGNVLNNDDIEVLLRKSNVLVAIDEAYIDFTDSQSWVTRLEEFPNLIVCQTLSKAWGMAGIRLGICYASEYIISILNKIKPPYNVNQLTQEKALTALGNNQDFQNNLRTILEQKTWLETELKMLSFVKRVVPSDANFFLVEFDDPKMIFSYLMERDIIVRDRTKELYCGGCLRITVGTPEENKKLINTLLEL